MHVCNETKKKQYNFPHLAFESIIIINKVEVIRFARKEIKRGREERERKPRPVTLFSLGETSANRDPLDNIAYSLYTLHTAP